MVGLGVSVGRLGLVVLNRDVDLLVEIVPDCTMHLLVWRAVDYRAADLAPSIDGRVVVV